MCQNNRHASLILDAVLDAVARHLSGVSISDIKVDASPFILLLPFLHPSSVLAGLAPSILYVVSFSPSYVVLSLKCAFHFSIQLDGLDPSWMLFMCTSYFVVSFSLAYQWCTTSNVFCSVLWHYLRPSELSVYQPCHCLNCSMTLTATSPSFCYVTLLWPLHFRPATSLLCCHFALVLPRHSRAVTSLLCCHVTLALPRRSQSCLSITFLTCLWLYRYVCLWPLGIPS